MKLCVKMATEQSSLISAIKKSVEQRSTEELAVIYSFLHGMEALSCLRESALKNICRTVRYQFHEANDILYCRGELATCWYILLSGSVFIDGSMFLPRSSFGKRTSGCARRPNECLILEPSEMLVIDYPDIEYSKHRSRHTTSTNHMTSIENYLGLETHDVKMVQGRYPDLHSESMPADLSSVQSLLPPRGGDPPQYLRSDIYMKRSSRASDTSSAYSGSDMMQSSSIDDGEFDLTGLRESLVDSDDEEGYTEERDSLIVRDTVRECLEKDPAERTEDDIETLLEFMQHLPAFANMTLATRRALCAVMVFAVVEKACTVVMSDGEELDSWSVILNGHVEVQRPDGTIEHLHMGDSFGITPTMEKLLHSGVMQTKVDDCQFVCIAQADYYRILNQGEENTCRHEEKGEVVMVTEHRILDAGNRKGHIVIRGTPERLMGHLVEEHSPVDPTYVEDFLLTYRTFLKTPLDVAEKLKSWFQDSKLRDKVTRVVLLWVNDHFSDFEMNTSMSEFLEEFERMLDQERMGGQLRLLNIACAAKALPRTIVLSRKGRDEVLHFMVLGGIERGCGIFISKVEKNSKAHEVGLKRGDQILEVNNHNFEHISHNRALEILRGTTTLSITVKSNLLAFKEMIATDKSPHHGHTKKDQIAHLQNDPKSRFNMPGLDDAVLPVIQPPKDKGGGSGEKKGHFSAGHKNKIRKALLKFNLFPKPTNSTESFSSFDDASSSYSRSGSGGLGGGMGPRKSSHSSTSSSPNHTPSLTHSHSNPDLSSLGNWGDLEGLAPGSRHMYPEYVIKVYKPDQTFKYLLIHRETTSREVVMLSLKEFGITESSSNYCLCEVSVENEGFVKTKRLPDQMASLPDRMTLNGRYYVKSHTQTETLVPDDLVPDLLKECQISLLQLNSSEVAAQLTLRDFHLFHDIQPTEYIEDLFELDSKLGIPHLADFSKLVNKEMFWVVTEVCSETNPVKRMKLLKHFIKIARHCKECKNFNSMFAIISGLGHGSVTRLRATWDRLPTKYIKMFEDLQDLMDPSRNMSKYRNLVNSERVQPPLIPFFPVVKKDLTFIHLGNDSKVENLINFEKLRMIAKEVRHTCNMASAQYDLSQMYLRDSQTVFTAFTGMNASAVATLRRKRRTSTVINPKKMFEEAQMVRRVRAYLQNMAVEEDEIKLSELSHQCEPPQQGGARKRDPSPNPVNLGPKFDFSRNNKGALERSRSIPSSSRPILGAESPDAVRKLMGLSEKVRPHNSKSNPLPPHHLMQPKSPAVGRKPPVSPRGLRQPAAPSAVNLSAESLGNMAVVKKGTKPSSKASDSSNSPTNSVGSYNQPDTDSGHNSITSSNFDAFSTSSNSPPPHKRHHVLAPSSYHHQPPPPPNTSRPPLPPYHVVVQNNSAYSEYLQQQYQHLRGQHHPSMLPSNGVVPRQQPQRPPLPDYTTATHHLARSQQQQQQQQQRGGGGAVVVGPNNSGGRGGLRPHHIRSHSLEGYLQHHQPQQFYGGGGGGGGAADKPQLVPTISRPTQQQQEEDEEGELVDGPDVEEEQVSAV